MNRFFALVSREYWENKNVFLMIPLILGAILVFCAFDVLLLSLFTKHVSFFFHLNNPNTDIGRFVSYTFFMISFPFAIVLWLVLFNYFLRTLYTERKDGSILFWQSMPIAQLETLLSKWLAGLVIAPLLASVVTIVTGIIVLVIVSILVGSLGVASPGALWSGANLLKSWFALTVAFFMQGVWLSPLLAWCLFCSASSTRAPFLRAILVPLVLIMVEFVLDGKHYIAYFIGHCFKQAINAWGQVFKWLGGAEFQLSTHSAQQALNQIHWINHHPAISATGFISIGLLVVVGLSLLAGWIRSRFYGCDI